MSNTTTAAAPAFNHTEFSKDVPVLLIHSAFAKSEFGRQVAPGRRIIRIDPRDYGIKTGVVSTEQVLHLAFEATNRPGAVYRQSITQGRCYSTSVGDFIRLRLEDAADGTPVHGYYLVTNHGFEHLTLEEFEAVEAARMAGDRYFLAAEALETLRK